MEHAHQPFAAFGEFRVGHAAGHRHAERDDQPDVAGMEGRMRRDRIPAEIVKALSARPSDRLVDPALLVARSEPGERKRGGWGERVSVRVESGGRRHCKTKKHKK